ncbi:MAG: glycosyltransferase [Flavobacteriales bacterium]|nr:glycosyltransferase [Flavobacteriales bacterium]
MAFIQMYYYLFSFKKLVNYNYNRSLSRKEAVSVIIAARNEKENLAAYLPLILNQNHENFEVIVVNNFSTDGSFECLTSFSHKRLKLIDHKGKKGKKAALQVGIEAAKYGLLLFTDADCKVNSEDWISLMSSGFETNTEFVLGFGAFLKSDTLLNKVIRFEGLLNAIQYFSFTLKGSPYMGVGRNLAYRKSTFIKAKGFDQHQNVLSGDDDLIVNQMATAKNVNIVIDQKSHMTSEAETNWLSFYRQKRRQLSAGVYYKPQDRLKLAVFGASNFLYYLLLVSLLLSSPHTLFIFGIFVLKQFCEYLVVGKLCQRLENIDLVIWLLIIEPIYLIVITIAGVSTWFRKVDRWK